MSLEALEKAIAVNRDTYVAALRRGLDKQLLDAPQAATEILFRLSSPPESPYVQNLCCLDIAWNAEDGSLCMPTVEIEGLRSSVGSLTLDGVEIVIEDFSWNTCEFVFQREPGLEPEFSAWFSSWIDQDSRAPVDGLRGVIHSAMKPVVVGDLWLLSVDFGSASPTAFIELIALICRKYSGRLIITTERVASE
jgi:hypothetical protein